MSNSIILVDASKDSITISWPETANAQRYVLQYRDGDDGAEFSLLSDKLTATQARKRNLQPSSQYFFRVGAVVDDKEPTSWVTHTAAMETLSSDNDANRMAAPALTLAGTNQALVASWKAPPSKADEESDTTYELQMRENVGDQDWSTLSNSLTNLEVRKKNLTSPKGYQFRVKAKGDKVFSTPSDVVVALGLSSGMHGMFKNLEEGTLLRGTNKIPLADALGGKEFVLLYVSAHWCGPCRNFTPKLAQWYQKMQSSSTNPIEIVFLSADHDEDGFASYYASMPWLAVDYDEHEREQIMGFLKVRGIPRLAVLDGRTGKVIVDNAVGQALDVNQWRKLVGR